MGFVAQCFLRLLQIEDSTLSMKMSFEVDTLKTSATLHYLMYKSFAYFI